MTSGMIEVIEGHKKNIRQLQNEIAEYEEKLSRGEISEFKYTNRTNGCHFFIRQHRASIRSIKRYA